VLRTIEVIALAIQLSQPAVTDEQAASLAQVLHEEAVAHDFDPLTGVAIISTESNFNPKAVSRSGEDLGLAQIRARYVGACIGTRDPVRNPTAACQQEKQRLLDPAENIRTMAQLISRHRNFCKSKVGSASFHRWLASYQGRNYPKKKVWCASEVG
jgi:Transglycosylase SLT domain